MTYKSFFSVIVLVLLFAFSAQSQEPGTAPGSPENAAAEVRRKAIDLLESVAGHVDSLRSPENRARIGSNIAELLWDHDEKRSRSLFAAVEEDIKTGMNEAYSDESGYNRTLMVFLKLRSDILDRIARHDPDLALEFLRATRPVPIPRSPDGMVDGEKSLELRLAGQIAAKNPQIALKIGLQSLRNGFSVDLLPVLFELQGKDKEASLSFYRAIVDKLKSANLAEDQAAEVLTLNLIRSLQPPEADEQVYRELIGVVLASALANGCGNPTDGEGTRICYEIGSVFSLIEKYHPQGAAPLRRYAGDAQNYYPQTIPAHVRDVIDNGTIDEMLALVERYPNLQGLVYWTAMSKAEAAGDVARARQIASRYPDKDQRDRMLAQIDYNQKRSSMNAQQLAAFQQSLSRFRNDEERIQSLLYLAIQVGRNDRKTALTLLNQASQMIDSAKPGKIQLEGQIRSAMLYCSLESDRGFTIMESLIPKLNELVAFASGLDGFENNYLRDGEWNMTGEGVVGGLLTALAQNAGYFAGFDFDRSVTLARQFERPELRLMAELKIAQSILTKEPQKIATAQAR